MDDFLKMDIFFAVTTAAVAILTAVFAFVLLRAWRVLGSIERISSEIEAETKLVRADVAELRTRVRQEAYHGIALARVAREFLQRIFRRKRAK
jgi:hypothetical protein